MKIGIDTFACAGGKSALGEYITQILKRIPPSGDLYELFGWDFDRFAFSEIAQQCEFIPQCFVNGETANALWHIFKYPEFVRKRKYTVCFFPAAHLCLSYKSPCPTVGVIHAIPSHWRQQWRIWERFTGVGRLVLPASIRKLDRIIAVSHWVKQELITFAGVKDSHIDVIPNGIDLTLFYPRPKNEESVLLIQPFSFRKPYILYESCIEHPSKNHKTLIEAFGIFKDRTHYPHRLVLAGVDGYGAEQVKVSATASRYRNDIFFTGYFPAKSLPELYAGAAMVVIPSMDEGFGSSVLAAMASGVPVACARSASLPETAGDTALYFYSRNSDEMAECMVTLATNRDVYRECRNAGMQRAQEFSWDLCAERTLQIIQETAGK
ncbi:MAG: glycosyltransferase family 4 protein [Spirochaetaceae bacterium]|nr:glycosyltransferase family 4 protein [Spirochaetaceae bacterium]